MSELLPCPFCGGSNLAEGFHSPFVICEDCGAFGPGSADITHEEAVNKWNTRAERMCECVAEYAESPFDGKTIVLHRCSACHELMRPHMRYCPNCGAKVIEEEE